MGNWKFLLQKEGDQNWHPLNQLTWDMEAGKYRLVGSCDRAKVNVEIIITYIITESGKIKRCTRKRSRMTNAQGLVLIIPFTQLQPGKWEINVSYNPTSDLESSSLETLQLLVKQKEGSPQKKNSSKKQNYSVSLPIQKRQPTSQFQITLDQDNFVRQPREKILISGRVEGKQALKAQVKPKLHYELKQPETGKILLEFQQNLLEEHFSYTLDLPRELETDSILGEVILEAWKKLSSDQQEKVTLANKLFRIKTYINQQQREEVMPSPKSLESGEQPELISFFPSKTVHKYQPAGSQILPPKINRTSSKKAFKAPQLPQFFQKKTLLTIRELAPNPTPGKINKDLEFKSLNSQNNSVSNNGESATVNQDNRDKNQDFEEVLKARFWSHINSLAGELGPQANLTTNANGFFKSEKPISIGDD